VIEVFLNAQRVNSPLDALVSDGAILMSMLLQYGCPAAEIHHAMCATTTARRRRRSAAPRN
jgi:hypothetical protein